MDFIKLDVQGGELSVLQGARVTLSRCLGVETEIEFAPIYKGQPLFGEISAYLEESSLTFIDFVSINRWGRYTYDGYGQAVFGDALFLRSPEAFAAANPVDFATQIRWVAICCLYNRFDLIERFVEIRTGPPIPDGVLSSVAVLRLRFEEARKCTERARRVTVSDRSSHFTCSADPGVAYEAPPTCENSARPRSQGSATRQVPGHRQCR